MKRLMLDYLRRKWWILATGALFQLVIGWATVSCAADHRFDPFSAFEFQISLFMGAFLLSFDLQRGIARTVAVLPLTARQIGRSWWWVTVGIPAISLAGLLFLGGGLFCLFNPGTTFPTEWLAMVSTITLLWLGTAFALIVNITPGWHGNWWGRTLNILFGSLWGLMIGGGGWLLRDVSNSPLKFYSVLGIGTIASVAGWFLAEQGVRGRAGFRLVASPLGKKKGPIHTPGGYGGIPFLISRSFVRTFLMGLAMITLMQLFLLFQGGLKSWHQAISSVTGMGVSYLWLIILTGYAVDSTCHNIL